MERLFAALKDSGLEWRIIGNFYIKVRPKYDQQQNNDKLNQTEVKFDIIIYKLEDTYVIDFLKRSGQFLVVIEYVAAIYKAIQH
jgi:hypothetical protein